MARTVVGNGVADRDPDLKPLLDALRGAHAKVDQALVESGLSAICRDCARIPERTCCVQAYKSVEGQIDTPLLALNFLLGKRLPANRPVAGRCWFLGEEGCQLAAKPFYCVNFICACAAGEIPGRALTDLRWAEHQGQILTMDVIRRVALLILPQPR